MKAATLFVQVNPLPVLTISSSPTLICTDKIVSLSATGALSYTWMPGNLSGSSLTVAIATPAIYTVTGNDGTCDNAATVSLNALPSPTILLSTSRSKICPGENSVITMTGAISYTLENTSAAISTNTISVSPAITTNYTVTGLASNGCTGSSVKTLTVSNCTGLETNILKEENDLWIYPNPSKGAFTLNAQKNMEIEISNNMGQLIKTIQLNEKNNFSSLITDLPEGIYFVGSVQNKTRKKIIVTH